MRGDKVNGEIGWTLFTRLLSRLKSPRVQKFGTGLFDRLQGSVSTGWWWR